MPLHQFKVAVGLCIAAHVLFVALLIPHWFQQSDARWIVDLGWLGAAAWAAIEWLAVRRRQRMLRVASLWFAASSVSYLAAVILWALVDLSGAAVSYPSAADVFYLLTPMFLVGGMFWLRPKDVVHRYRMLQMANLGLVAAATTILAVFAIAPLIANVTESLAFIAMSIGYWAVYLSAAAFTTLALVGFKWRERRLVMLLASVTGAFVIAAIPYAYELIEHSYKAGVWYDVLWFTAPCLMALAARDFGVVANRDDQDTSITPPRNSRVVPSALMAGTVLVLGVSTAKTLGVVPGYFLIVAAGTIALALAVRERAIKQIESRLEAWLQAALLEARANEERFRAFAEVTSDFFIETDDKLIIRNVITGPDSTLDLDVDWLKGRVFGHINHPSWTNFQPTREELCYALGERQIFRNYEYEASTGDGGRIWRRYGGAPHFAPNGSFLGYRISFQDITWQKRLEQENREKAAELSRVVRALDSATEIIYILDADDRVTYLNAAADATRSTRTTFKAIGRHFAEVSPSFTQQNPGIVDRIRAHVKAMGAWTGEAPVTHGTRAAIFDVRAAALPDGGIIIAGFDVADRKARERRELALTVRLGEAEKAEAIGKLAGAIAHDFNNIIAAIRSFAGLIVHDLPEGHIDRSYAQRIVNSSERASELVRQILLFARAGNAEHKPVPLRNVLEELENTLVPTMPSNIFLQIDLPKIESIIDGSAAQLLQVLMNLSLNAADAVSSSGGVIEISCEKKVLSIVEAAELSPGVSEIAGRAGPPLNRYVTSTLLSDQPYYCISIEDNGPGIPADILPRVFEPFFTTKERTKGTGLGLAVVNSIVKAHNGAIVVLTAPSQGTVFQLFFPAIEATAKEVSTKNNLGIIQGKERVLVVDDEVDVADGLSLALQRLGYETAPIYSSEEALEVFAEDPSAWDVVVTDQIMPKIQGLELTRKLKGLNADVEIIVCTGFSDTATEEKAIEAGASAFMFKPVAPEIIAQMIRRLCNKLPGRLEQT